MKLKDLLNTRWDGEKPLDHNPKSKGYGDFTQDEIAYGDVTTTSTPGKKKRKNKPADDHFLPFIKRPAPPDFEEENNSENT